MNEEYIEALEEERRKIRVFQRELPLCLELVTQTIESWKQGLVGSEKSGSEEPDLEEFIPVKGVSDCAQQGIFEEDEDGNSRKSDLLRSVQLWSQNPDPVSNSKLSSPRRVAVIEVQRNGCAFHPFTDSTPMKSAPPSSSSTVETSGARKKQDKESQRKARRCWSLELHERFLHALEKLGGSQRATPKQIRELMQMDGLTNDEVKSHLQKYRLHARRPGSSPNPATPAMTEATPQFVVVGGIWVPSAMGKTASAGEVSSPEIYAPVAKHPNPFQEPESDSKGTSERAPAHGNASV